MGIRLKIIFVVLPVLVAAVVLAGMSSYFVAASSVTRVAVDFLDFKASGVETYADSQWNLLVENGFVGRPEMEEAARAAVEAYARSVLRSPHRDDTRHRSGGRGRDARRPGAAVCRREGKSGRVGERRKAGLPDDQGRRGWTASRRPSASSRSTG